MNCVILFQLRQPPNKKAGFTLTEIMVVIFIMTVLISISLSGFSHTKKPDPVMKAADQVIALLRQTQAEAVSSKKVAALIVNNESSHPGFQRSLNIGLFSDSPTILAPLSIKRRWLTLPKNVVIEFSYSNPDEPNAYFTTGVQGGSTIGLGKGNVSGSTTERHPAVKCLLFDRYGSVIAHNGKTWIQYINNRPSSTQKGCYIILRNSQKRPSIYMGGNDLSHLAKIYISPLTGHVSKI